MLCDSQKTPKFIEALNIKLTELGYLDENIIQNKRSINFQTKEALTKYQEAHALPVGNLNMETLQELGLQK